MISIIKYIRILLQELKKKWIIEIRYPQIYPNGLLKSIVPLNLIKNSNGLYIEPEVQIKNSDIIIGKHTYIGYNTKIDSCNSIGSFCSISSDVKIGMRNHPLKILVLLQCFIANTEDGLKKVHLMKELSKQ